MVGLARQRCFVTRKRIGRALELDQNIAAVDQSADVVGFADEYLVEACQRLVKTLKL